MSDQDSSGSEKTTGRAKPENAQPARPTDGREPGLEDGHPGERADRSDDPVEHPVMIGPYRVIGHLGAGGMGEVFLAEQEEPIRRRVAIKLMNGRSLRSPEARYRFESECLALARMSHPNIAHIHDSGTTEDGQPFIAMEYVEGSSITTFSDQHCLGIEARLHIFSTVCEVIQHAHEKGIIHRDIKPSNILVALEQGRPVVKIIDFGIAKTVDHGPEEGDFKTGARVVGTPAYLSPEAFLFDEEGPDLDTRSDVYALGVLLCELLVGTQPFARRTGNYVALLRSLQDEPLPPSIQLTSLKTEKLQSVLVARACTFAELRRRVWGDLDWITIKAMERERSDRYRSAADLAEDLRRHRANEPVLAGPPGALYRLLKFVKRHRVSVAAALVVALSLVVGLAARTQEARRANREAAAAQQAREEAEEIASFLVELFRVSAPGRSRGESVTARELLDKAARDLQQDSHVRPVTRARLMHTIGSVYIGLGLLPSAETAMERALEIREQELGTRHSEVAQSLSELGELYRIQGRYAEAEPILRRALEIRSEAVGTLHRDYAENVFRIAILAKNQGRLDEAEALYQQSLDIFDQSEDGSGQRVAAVLNSLAGLYWVQTRYDEAAVIAERALSIRRELLGADHPEVAQSLNNLGILNEMQERYDEAEGLYRGALAIREKTQGPEHPDVAASLHNLGELALTRQRHEEARVLFERALAIAEKALGPKHPDVSKSLLALARVHLQGGDPQEALPLALRAREITEEVFGSEHLEVAEVHHLLGDLFSALDRLSEAEGSFRSALDIYRIVSESDHPGRIEARDSYARILVELGRDQEAAALASDG